MTFYKVIIDLERQNSPADNDSKVRSHRVTEKAYSEEEVEEMIKRHVNVENLEESGRPMYRDTEDGHEQVGKIYSYWQNLQSGNVWETAWVEIKELEAENVGIEDTLNEVEA